MLLCALCLIATLPVAASPGLVRVGIYDNKPLVFMGDMRPEGLFVDILEAVAEEQGWRLEYRYGSWDASYKALLAGELDLLPVVAYSAERATLIAYSQTTVIANWGEIYTRRGLTIASISDLQDRAIAYLENDTHSLFFRALLDKLLISYTALRVGSYTEMLAALEDGRADAGVFNHIQASLASRARLVQVTPIVFNPIEIRFAAPKGDSAGFLPHLDFYLTALKAHEAQEYERLVQRWLGGEPRGIMPVWVGPLILAILICLLLVIMVNLWLRGVVRKRTADLEASNLALKEGESRYRTILSSAMDGYLMVDGQGRIVEANEAYARMSGYGIGELIGLHTSDLDVKDDRAAVQQRLERLKTERYERFESVHRRKDGSEYAVEVSLQYDAEDPGRLIAFVRDISEREAAAAERMRAERAIRELAEYQRALLDYSPLAMFSMDRDGRVIMWNPAAERTFGWSRDEAVGRVLPIVPEDKRGEFYGLKERLLGGEGLAGLELKRMKKTGEIMDVSLWAAPIYDAQGGVIGIISFVEDIGERKAIEKRLKDNLEEKQILLREIHHRVKNNLAVISSLLNLQSATITDPAKAIEAFKNSRDRIMAMALVHMELYESGNFARIDMHTYIRNLADHIAMVNERAGAARLDSEAEPIMLDLQVAVPCGLILNELITNAYKYALSEGGHIELSMKRGEGGSVVMTVKDNGPGLPEGYESSGSLGLTLVRLLVGQIDGELTITSSSAGTQVRIALPAPSPKADGGEAA